MRELCLEALRLKKPATSLSECLPYQRMSAGEKMEVINKVGMSPLPKSKVLTQLGVSGNTYYRWLKRRDEQGLVDQAREGSESCAYGGSGDTGVE